MQNNQLESMVSTHIVIESGFWAQDIIQNKPNLDLDFGSILFRRIRTLIEKCIVHIQIVHIPVD